MKIEITFSEPPTVTQFCHILDGIGEAWPHASITEPTNGLKVYIDCHEEGGEDAAT
jgi:hypothetical protein